MSGGSFYVMDTGIKAYKHPLYGTWTNMKRRCLNPHCAGYKNYGGRGISICARWADDFEAFAADMGPKPSPTHSIDRINNDGNYEPGNCRWATPLVQGGNKRRHRKSIVKLRRIIAWSLWGGLSPSDEQMGLLLDCAPRTASRYRNRSFGSHPDRTRGRDLGRIGLVEDVEVSS